MEKDIKIAEAESRVLASLRKVIRTVDVFSAGLRDSYDLNTSRMACLKVLLNGNIALNEISKRTYLSPSSITIIIDDLEERHLVERKRTSDDRRVIIVGLTEIGRKIAKEAPPTVFEKLENGLHNLTKQEILILDKSLAKLAMHINPEDFKINNATGPLSKSEEI